MVRSPKPRQTRTPWFVCYSILLVVCVDQALVRLPLLTNAGSLKSLVAPTGRDEPPYFRLLPGIDLQHPVLLNPERTTRVVTNSLGFRDREREWKRSDALRILAIGDSHTFGQNVEFEQSYPAQLERALHDSYGNVEVWNAGAPGQQMEDHLGSLRGLLPLVQPDLLLLQLTENDAVTPTPIPSPVLRSARYSGLARLFVVFSLNCCADTQRFLRAYDSFIKEASAAGVAVVVWSESLPEGVESALSALSRAADAEFVATHHHSFERLEDDPHHLSAEGYRRVVERLTPVIIARLPPPNSPRASPGSGPDAEELPSGPGH